MAQTLPLRMPSSCTEQTLPLTTLVRDSNPRSGARLANRGLVAPLPLLNWRPRCMEPAEKRPLRSRFGCRRRAPSERRRLRPSRGTIIHGPVHDSPAGRLVAPRPLLSWWLRRVEPVEKRPLRFRFGCRGRAPSERRRLKPSRGVIIGGPVHDSPTKGLVASRPLLGWRPRCMELAEKRPLRSHFG